MENTKNCHIFDLDNTLWSIDRNIWVIDKRYPGEPIFKIEESEFNLIKSGTYKKSGNRVFYSGHNYYLSNDLKDRIEKLKVPILNVGFSLIEFKDKDIIESLNVDINDKLIYKLRNKVDDIYIISDSLRDIYKKQLDKLEKSLEKFGHQVKEYYFVSENLLNKDSDGITWTKGLIILKHLIGLNIKDSQFINEEVVSYNEVNYYDSNEWILKHLEKINFQFNKIYHNSTDSVKKDILKRFSGHELNLNIFEVSNNMMRPLIEKSITLNRPSNIMLFESFTKNINK